MYERRECKKSEVTENDRLDFTSIHCPQRRLHGSWWYHSVVVDVSCGATSLWLSTHTGQVINVRMLMHSLLHTQTHSHVSSSIVYGINIRIPFQNLVTTELTTYYTYVYICSGNAYCANVLFTGWLCSDDKANQRRGEERRQYERVKEKITVEHICVVAIVSEMDVEEAYQYIYFIRFLYMGVRHPSHLAVDSTSGAENARLTTYNCCKDI